ncbi:hypothetical protein ACQUSR_04475 [Streptomyces sp. P1-3]|uniref:hypothetical protein n=1 Tax=Streptomyces sp. P1-3 TaxID=3421658 RepID=UPI003D35F3CA
MISASTTTDQAEYEALVEATLRELAAAETDDVLVPVDGGGEGPTMAWMVST